MAFPIRIGVIGTLRAAALVAVLGLGLAGSAHRIADLPISVQPASVSDQGTWPLKGNDFDETSFAGYHASFPAPELRAAS